MTANMLNLVVFNVKVWQFWNIVEILMICKDDFWTNGIKYFLCRFLIHWRVINMLFFPCIQKIFIVVVDAINPMEKVPWSISAPKIVYPNKNRHKEYFIPIYWRENQFLSPNNFKMVLMLILCRVDCNYATFVRRLENLFRNSRNKKDPQASSFG